MVVAGSIALMAFLGCGLYGWGGVARRAMGLPAGTWPMTVAIGLAAWIAIGGVLNLLHIAWPATICLLLAAGCGFMAWSLRAGPVQPRDVDPKQRKGGLDRVYAAVWLGLAAVIIGFAAVTQSAPDLFNAADDYQKYLGYAVRMVQTGTLAGSPLNTLGSEMGGQAFLHGLFAGLLPLAAINTADAVFCFGLTVLLAGGVALRRPALAPAALLAMMAVWLIEPQYVNVSALFSGAALMFAVATLGVDKREYAAEGAVFSPAAATGLIYAALVSLKTTFALFAVVHFLFCTAADVLATRRAGAAIRRALATAGWGLLFVAPWVALYSPLYWTAMTAPAAGLPMAAPVPAVETLDALSTKALYWGGSFIQYTFAAAAFLVCGAATLVRGKPPNHDVARFVALCLAVPCAYLVMLLTMGPVLSGYETALRYFVPSLIGTLPAVLVLCGEVTSAGDEHGRRNLVTLMSAGLAAVIAIWSVPDFWTRYQFLVRTGSMLAYVRNWPAEQVEKVVPAVRNMLQEPSLSKHLAELQQQVPAGEPLLAWIETPFLLDFRRNPIVDADIAGLANPWSRTPPVSWVLWQYAGIGVRQPKDYAAEMQGPGRHETYLTARGLVYAGRLQSLLTRSQVVANDGNVVLLRIGPDAKLP
jgi:hypothetical protein